MMNSFCWHDWTKWGEPKIVHTQEYPVKTTQVFAGELMQRRECSKCNKIEYRRL